MDRFSGVYVFALLILIFGLWVPDTFLTLNNARVVATDQAITGLLALALVLPFAAGVFDLSVAALLGLSVCLVGWMQEHGWNAALSVVLTLLIGAAVGAFNGFSVVRLRVSSFITTLGMSSILAGAAYWVTGGQQITQGWSESFLNVSRWEISTIGMPVFYLLALALVLWYLLEYTTLGRYVYAVGGNPQAARLAGVRADRIVFGSLVASGTLAALAGIVLAARLGTASSDIGPGYLLPAFSAVFLGATQLKPGRVNVWGTLLAVYLLAVGVKGLQLAGAQVYVDELFNGAALILAVALAARSERAKA